MDSVDEDHHRSPKDEEQVTVPEPASKNGAGEDHHVEPKASNRCLVYCRLRPSNKRDFVAAGSSPLITVSGNCAVVKDERRYNFDGTFGVESSQEEIFHSVAIPCIDHAFRGCRSALMCYGQTGTGKTYTLCSTKEGQEGIIPRAAKYIFDEIIAKHPERRYVVEAQFVQIYRDKLNDLLQTPEKAAADRLIPSKALDIRCDDVDGVTLTGVQSQVLTSSEEMVKLFHTGNARRVVGTTAMNAESSRGHSALIVWISNEDPSNLRAGRTMGKLTIIDLAGYERFSKTGITTDNTIQKDEAKTINASLLALGHVVSALSSGSRHIPWRDSKLTRLLQDSVGGRSRTSIILTVGPSSEHFHETANTLQFGMRSMCVKVETRVAVSVDYVELSRILEGEVTKRDALIDTLRAENREHVEQQRLVDQRYFEDRQRLQDTIEEERKRVVSAGGNEEQLKKLTEVLEVEAENLKEQQCEEISYQEEAFSQRVVRTIEVDRFRTERDIAQYKILYEKNMEDLKKKLDATRGARTNEDLLRALQTIAEKDVIIAARATETASLHEVIAQLADQLESHGVAPALNVDLLARNFMDVSQVEEIQQQLRDENEDLRAKLVDLRAQLDRMTSIANHRKDEINNLHKMLQQLRSSGVAVPEVESESRGATDLVGREEVELMRLSMQARLDDVAMECSRLREELKTRVRAEEVPMTARRMHVPGSVEATPRREVSLAFGMTPRGPFTARRTNANTTSTSAVVGVESLRHSYESIIEQLRHEVATLRTAAMKGGAATSNGAAATTTTAVREGSPAPSLPVPPLMLRQWGSTARDILEEDGDHLHGAVESGAAHNNVDFVVGVKEAEVEAVVKAMLLQEQQIANDRAVLQYSGELIKILRLQLRMAQLVPDAPQSAAPPPFLGLSQRTYTALLDKLRQENRKLAGRLLLPTSASSEDVMTIEKVLADRDAAISAKDAALLEMSATNEYVSKIASRLLGQLQNLKITPCVAVPDAIQDQCGPASSEAIAELEADLQQERDSNERLDVQLRMLRQERERIAYGVRLQQEDQVSHTMARMGCEITDLNDKVANQDAEIRRLQKENDELRAAKGWGPMQFFLGGTSPSKKKADSPTTTTPVTSGRYRDPSTSVEREDWPNSALHY